LILRAETAALYALSILHHELQVAQPAPLPTSGDRLGCRRCRRKASCQLAAVSAVVFLTADDADERG
jgi:hypothetical protein